MYKLISGEPEIPLHEALIRPFQAGLDVNAWLGLKAACFGSASARAWTKIDFEREFLNRPAWDPRNLLLAELESRLVGSVACVPSGRIGTVNWLMVASQARCRGIGRQLMLSAERRFWEIGVTRLELTCLASWTAAISLYTSLGYRESDESGV